MSVTLKLMFATAAARAVWSDHPIVKPRGDAGLDLYCVEDVVVPARGQGRIDFQVRCEMTMAFMDSTLPASFYLVPRSSIVKTPLRMSNSVGVIDSGYRGNIVAFVDNLSDEPYVVRAGERLFQVVHPMLSPISIRVVDELTETERGDGGFGSTGK